MDRMVVAGKLKFYSELLANVRNDGQYYPIRSLVQVDDSEVREIARVLTQADNFTEAVHEFVNSFTSYRREIGDFWALPSEMLGARAGDCDDSSILLCSLLRNYLPPEKVFVGFGVWSVDGSQDGHAWVVVQAEDGTDMVLESTAHPRKTLRGKYILDAMFNDQYVFATDIGVKDFDLRVPVEEESHEREVYSVARKSR
jgi:hypothetical protein